MDNLSQQMGSISITSPQKLKTTLTLCSWNVQKLSEKSTEKLTIIADTLRGLNCDVIALQEVSTDTVGEILAKSLKTTTSTWSADSHVICEGGAVKEYSVLLWNNSSISDVEPKLEHKRFSRILHYINFKYNEKSMRIANFHFKTRNSVITNGVSQKVTNDREQDALYDLFQTWPNKYLFAVGDFNCYPMSFDHSTGQMRSNYCQLLHPRMYTNYIQDDCYDNVLVRPHMKTNHNPKASVNNPVKQYYTIDATKNKTRLISDHKPIRVIFKNI